MTPSEAKSTFFKKLKQFAKDGDPANLYHENADWFGSHPFNEIKGHSAIVDVWKTITNAIPDMERRDSIFVAGLSKPDVRMPDGFTDRLLIASLGTYQGTFEKDLLHIPATHGVVHLRFCEVHHIKDGLIEHSYVMLDFLDLMRQAGVWPIPASLGAEHVWPTPASMDGVRPEICDEKAGDQAFDVVMGMHAALLSFDGVDLDSMKHSKFWDEHFMWYGPSGIGSTRAMSGFRAHHQIPFLTGFPDRKGAGHYIRIGDGNYVVTGGWPSVVGTHTGEWLGMPATGKIIDMRVMDFYRIEDGKICENWVPIDVIHMLKQMGFDVFKRLKHLKGLPERNLTSAKAGGY